MENNIELTWTYTTTWDPFINEKINIKYTIK